MSELAERRRRGRPRKERGAASTRSAIVRAAADEFTERGYEAASLRAVARRAGVDSALVHHYFDDKAELFAATLEAPCGPTGCSTSSSARPGSRSERCWCATCSPSWRTSARPAGWCSSSGRC
ncbi:TetR/AcrR family transcriptional regulator [Leifsonia sp. P73]|uniref:TetR/AcrR family transcriptional regulator n=1 Tax=Leifsonia sp. P73 TaxID=3423959 RepID=UPI003DA5A608